MKKVFLLLMVCSLVLAMISSIALAEDLSIQILKDGKVVLETVSLDDLQLGMSYTIKDYTVVLPREAKIVDCFAQFGEAGDYSSYVKDHYSAYKDKDSSLVYCDSDSKMQKSSWRYTDASWMDSGDTASFVWCVFDITNLQKKDVDFTEDVTVKAVYKNDYEFSGWVRQIVSDHMDKQNGDQGVSRYNYDKDQYPNEIVMNPLHNEPVQMMYTGTYVFGCTLPNYVIEDKDSPLRIEIELGGNEMTYNMR